MSQYPGYPYPAYQGYPADYYAAYAPYGYPQAAQGNNPYTATSRHARLPPDGNGAAYPPPPPSREGNPSSNANAGTRRGQHPRRNTTAQAIPSKENRILGYEPASVSDTYRRRDLTPDFIFVSLSSSDVLKLSGPLDTTKYLAENIRVSWAGSTTSRDDAEIQVRLGREAWVAGGATGLEARKLVCDLFVELAQEGFRYLTTINNHPLKAPRLVFTSGTPEKQPRYFMICFSLNRRTAHIIGAPEQLAQEIAITLRVVAPTRPNEAATMPARTDGWVGHGHAVYEVTTSIEGGRVDFAALMSGALKFIAAEGWRFEASVPFGRAGLLGVRGRREAWLFHRDPDFKPRVPIVNGKLQQQQQQQQAALVTSAPRVNGHEYGREYREHREHRRRASAR